MNAQKQHIVFFSYLTAALSLLASGAYLLSYLTAFEPKDGYYAQNAIFPTVLAVAFVLVTLLAFSALLVFRRAELTPAAEKAFCTPSKMEQILGAISALAFFFILIKHLHFYYVQNYLPITRLVLLSFLGLLASCLFYLGFYTTPKNRCSNLTLMLGYTALVHPIYVIISMYSDFYTPMNHPAKIVLELASVVMVLFILVELRTVLSLTRASFYIATAILAIGVLSPVALFGCLYSLTTEKSTLLYRSFCMLCTPVLLFVLARAVRFTRLLCNPPAEDALTKETLEAESAEQTEACNVEGEEEFSESIDPAEPEESSEESATANAESIPNESKESENETA